MIRVRSSRRRKVKSVAVFLGPTLPRAEARSILDADYYPPAGRGDIYRCLTTGVRIIVVIDGVFHGAPAVWQRELLAAVQQGIRVIGASSMGALRAAELHRLGMIGCGAVFRWYREGTITGDDEVALLHGAAEADYRPLSEPLVNIRATLEQAVSDHCLTGGEARELIADAQRTFYQERSFEGLLRAPCLRAWPEERRARLRSYIGRWRVDLKRRDGIEALHLAARLLRKDRPAPARRMQAEAAWAQRERLFYSGFVGREIWDGARILEAAARDADEMRSAWRRLSGRKFLLEWARQNEVRIPRKYGEKFARAWARKYGSHRRGWLPANGLTAVAFSQLLAERALTEWLTERGPGAFALPAGFLESWAQQNGIQPPRTARKKFADWIVRRGPDYFGLDWRFDVALMQDLQLSGRAGEIADKLSAG